MVKKNERILREQVRLAMRQLNVMLAASIFISLTLAVSVRKIAPVFNIAAWFAGVAAMAAIRMVVVQRFKKVEGEPFDAHYWQKVSLISSLFSGIVWASSAFAIFPSGDVPLISLFVLTVTSISVGMSVSHAALRFGPAAWIAPTMSAYAVRFFWDGGEYGYYMGFLLLLYAGAILLYAQKNNNAIVASISMQFENLELIEEIRNANKMKDQFVALISHDLRSPLFGIKGMLDIFREENAEYLLKGGENRTFDRLSESINGLIALMERLLEHARLKTGDIRPEMMNFNARVLVQELIARLSHMASVKNIVIKNELPDSTQVYADPDLYGQALHNLLSNAIKFSGRGGEITVSSAGESEIVVQDNGVGIEEKLLADLFNENVRTTTYGTDGEKGTGLGLPYSYNIMKAHGGELRVVSKKGEGTEFRAVLSQTSR